MLWNKLKEIFKEGDEHRIKDIEKTLYKEAISMSSDLKFVDEKFLVELNYFKPVEIKKLLEAKEEIANSLKYNLGEIFGDISPEKRNKIEKYFNEVEVFTIEDLFMFGLAKVAQSSDIFSSLDVEKLKNFIRKNYPEIFKEIKEKEDQDKIRRDMQFRRY